MRIWRIVASVGALLALLIVPATAQLDKVPGDATPNQLRTPVTTDLTWRDMGCALGGTFTPHLAGSGTLEGGELVTLTMSNVICDSPAILVIGFSSIHQDLLGGILVPEPQLIIITETPPLAYRFRDGTVEKVEVGTPVSGRLTPVDSTGGSVPCYQGAGAKAPRPLRLDAGILELQGIFPYRVASGTHLYFQFWVLDDAGPRGWCASNAVLGLTP